MVRVSIQRPLADTYGRVATDLRVSLTDRCNLRCSYCMPAEGLDWLPHAEVLTDDEVVRLIAIGVERLGVREVRFTGGEPLVRRGLVDIVRRTRALGADLRALDHHQRARPRAQRARRWPRPGSTGSTSASTPSTPSAFHTITRRDRLDDVLRGRQGRPRRRAAAGQDQRRAAARASTTTTRCELLDWAVDHELRAALHRADAARRPARLAPRADGHRRRDLRQAGRRVHAHPGHRAPRQRARRAVPGRRRPGDGGRDRLGDPARSAATATGSGSPPTVRSATACSPARSPTCARPCAAARPTTRSPTAG